MPRICLALLLLLLTGQAWAWQPAPLNQDELRLSLGPYMAYLENRNGSLTFEEVRALAKAFRSTPSQAPAVR